MSGDSNVSGVAAPTEIQHGFTRREYWLLFWGLFGAVLVTVAAILLQSMFKELYARNMLSNYRRLSKLEVIEFVRIVSEESSLKELQRLLAEPDNVPPLFIGMATARKGEAGLAALKEAQSADDTKTTPVRILAGLEYGKAGYLEPRLANLDAEHEQWLKALRAAALVDAYTAIDFGREIAGHYICLFPGKKEIDPNIMRGFENELNRLLANPDEERDSVTGMVLTKTAQVRLFLDKSFKDNPQIYKPAARAKWKERFETMVIRQFERRDISLRYKQLVRAYAERHRSDLSDDGWNIVNRFLSERYPDNPTDQPAAADSAGNPEPGSNILPAHRGAIMALAFSPTSGELATAGFDNQIRIWPATPTIDSTPRVLAGHEFGVMAVAWSPDGKRLASCGLDNSIRFWDAAAGRETGRIGANTKRAAALVFSPDGKFLAVAGPKATVRLIASGDGTEMKVLSGLKGEAFSLAFSPGGRYVVAASRDRSVRAWDLIGGDPGKDAPPTQLPEKANSFVMKHGDEVWSLAISPDSRFIATGGADRVARSFSLKTESETGVPMNAHRMPITAIAWAPDSKCCASFGIEGRIILWEPEKAALGTMHRIPSLVNAMAFSRHGRTIWMACDDGTLRSWNVQPGQIEARTFSEWVVDTFSRTK